MYYLVYKIFISYWFDMEVFAQVRVRCNIARRQERNINYSLETEVATIGLHSFKISIFACLIRMYFLSFY